MKPHWMLRVAWVTILLSAGTAHAAGVLYKKSVQAPVDEVYEALHEALEAHRMWVVFEADIGANIARFRDQWGEDYNRNGLEAIRVLVVCNGWYANRVGNEDPDMLALCPQRVTVIHRGGRTTVLFVRPTVVAGSSPAGKVLAEVEDAIVAAIDEATAGP